MALYKMLFGRAKSTQRSRGGRSLRKYGSVQQGRGLKIMRDVAHTCIILIFYYAYKI